MFLPELLFVGDKALKQGNKETKEALQKLGLTKIIQALCYREPSIKRHVDWFFNILPDNYMLILHRQKFFQDAITHPEVMKKIYHMLASPLSPKRKIHKLLEEIEAIIGYCRAPCLQNFYMNLREYVQSHRVASEKHMTYQTSKDKLAGITTKSVSQVVFIEACLKAFAMACAVNHLIDLVGMKKTYLTFPIVDQRQWHYDGLYNLEQLINENKYYPQKLNAQSGVHLTVSGNAKTGKTTLLSAIGQAFWLAQLGLPVPAKRFQFVPTSQIIVDRASLHGVDLKTNQKILMLVDGYSQTMISYINDVKVKNKALVVTSDRFPLVFHQRHLQNATRYVTSIRQNYFRFVSIEPEFL